MKLNGKSVFDLTEQDLLQLLEDRREEDRFLDFKREAYSNSDADKRELLKDVVGFANASGGVILIGIEDENDVAIKIPGVDLDQNGKDPMERYERTIRDSSEPRLVGVTVKAIRVGSDNKVVIAIGVPQSLNRPHRVKAAGSQRWTIRHNRDTIDKTYAEIRSAFIDGANILTNARNFQSERCSAVNSMGTHRGIILLHVIPLASDDHTLDVPKALQCKAHFFPPGLPDTHPLQPNFDGVRGQTPSYEKESVGWCQVYRDGRVEGMRDGYVRLEGGDGDIRRHLIIDVERLQSHILGSFEQYISGLFKLNFYPPYALCVSLLNPGRSYMKHQRNSDKFFDLPLAKFEPIIVETENFSADQHSVMKPVFDQLWNAYGFSESKYFHLRSG